MSQEEKSSIDQDMAQEEQSQQNHKNTTEQELEASRDSYLRVLADFNNYKRRTEQERQRWVKAGQAELIVDLLEIVDNFDRALAEHEKKEQTPELNSWLQGFELIHKALYKMLSKHDVKELGNHHTFDPELHEALMQVESADHVSGKIVHVMQKVYTFKGDVVRPAKVSVAK